MKPAHNLTTQLDITLTVCDIELEMTADVIYDYIPAERGSRERGSGIQLEPDYAEGIELLSFKLGGCEMVGKLSESQVEAITEDLLA